MSKNLRKNIAGWQDEQDRRFREFYLLGMEVKKEALLFSFLNPVLLSCSSWPSCYCLSSTVKKSIRVN
ncbi:MAG TPA: hypothetical protein VLG76_06490 [Rhabdochlamydiaceae bacterium]|nr:hypothetical protein [Rhabdochlamydiaceae bacterium]